MSQTKPSHAVPSGGVVGLIQRNTDEGRCPLDNPSEVLKKASLLLLLLLLSISIMVVLHPVVIILRLSCWVWVLACVSERFGYCGKIPTTSTRNYNKKIYINHIEMIYQSLTRNPFWLHSLFEPNMLYRMHLPLRVQGLLLFFWLIYVFLSLQWSVAEVQDLALNTRAEMWSQGSLCHTEMYAAWHSQGLIISNAIFGSTSVHFPL